MTMITRSETSRYIKLWDKCDRPCDNRGHLPAALFDKAIHLVYPRSGVQQTRCWFNRDNHAEASREGRVTDHDKSAVLKIEEHRGRRE